MDLEFKIADTFQIIDNIYLFSAWVSCNNFLFHTVSCDFLRFTLTGFWF